MSLNMSSFPLIATWFFMTIVNSDAMTVSNFIERNGISVAFVIALGAFTVWKEKRLEKRDNLDREERRMIVDNLKEEIVRYEKELSIQMEWMRNKIDQK